ncbi:MAG: hypothetical protein ABIK83_07455 [Candidatus Zixiibacteriota bacterium]
MGIWKPQGKIDYEKPVITADVNSVYTKDWQNLPDELGRLPSFEFVYFYKAQVEMCVTPKFEDEVLQGKSLEEHGPRVYRRVKKSQLFKLRPSDYILGNMDDKTASELWTDIRDTMWPSVSDANLTTNQINDVDQIFYHTTASGFLSNAAFITFDGGILNRASDLFNRFGIKVLTANEAWEEYSPKYGLYEPNQDDLDYLARDYTKFYQKLKMDSGAE